jgi:hypothetical protein
MNRAGNALWWRLLLAVSLLAAPVAVSGAAVATGAWRAHPAMLQAKDHVARPAAVASGRLATVERNPSPRAPAPMLADLAVGVALFSLCLLAASRRRRRRVAGNPRRAETARAPPERATSFVPFGPASGRAGRIMRSICARFLCVGGTVRHRPA